MAYSEQSTTQTRFGGAEITDPAAVAAAAVDVAEGWEETAAGDEQVVVWERAGGFPDLREKHTELRTTGWEIAVKDAEYGPTYAVIARPMCKGLAFRSQTLLKTSDVEAAAREVSRFMETVEATPNGWSLIERDGGERHRWLSWDGAQMVEVWQEDRNFGEAREFTTTVRETDSRPLDRPTEAVTHAELMDAVAAAADHMDDVDGYPAPKWEPTVETA